MKQIEKTEILNSFFEGYYEALYQRPDTLNTSDAVKITTDALEKVPAIKNAFLNLEKYRQDQIFSDREYAAFLMAYVDAESAIKELEKKERARARKRRAYRKQYGNLIGDILYLDDINKGRGA